MSTHPTETANGVGRPAENPAGRPHPRIVHWTSGLLEWIGIAAVILMMLNVVVDVVMRTVFNSPIPGTLELVTYWYIVAISFIGMWLAQRRREHISVTLVFERLSLGGKRTVAVVGNILTALLLLLFVWFGLETAIEQARIGEYSGATEVPIWPMRFVVPVTLAAWLVVLVVQTVEIIRKPHVLNTEHDMESGLI